MKHCTWISFFSADGHKSHSWEGRNWPASYTGENVKQAMNKMLCSSNTKPGRNENIKKFEKEAGGEFF